MLTGSWMLCFVNQIIIGLDYSLTDHLFIMACHGQIVNTVVIYCNKKYWILDLNNTDWCNYHAFLDNEFWMVIKS